MRKAAISICKFPRTRFFAKSHEDSGPHMTFIQRISNVEKDMSNTLTSNNHSHRIGHRNLFMSFFTSEYSKYVDMLESAKHHGDKHGVAVVSYLILEGF